MQRKGKKTATFVCGSLGAHKQERLIAGADDKRFPSSFLLNTLQLLFDVCWSAVSFLQF
jgi:hypothetical protein